MVLSVLDFSSLMAFDEVAQAICRSTNDISASRTSSEKERHEFMTICSDARQNGLVHDPSSGRI
jgi:hypothetical protein